VFNTSFDADDFDRIGNIAIGSNYLEVGQLVEEVSCQVEEAATELAAN